MHIGLPAAPPLPQPCPASHAAQHHALSFTSRKLQLPPSPSSTHTLDAMTPQGASPPLSPSTCRKYSVEGQQSCVDVGGGEEELAYDITQVDVDEEVIPL